MSFEWNEEKNRENQKKHGVSFEEAKRIFDGPVFIRDDDRYDYGEERQVSLGMAGDLAILVVAHTDRNGKTRIISARKATKAERKIYHERLKEIIAE